MHFWRTFFFCLVAAILFGVGSFGWSVFKHYRAIQRGESNPILDQVLSSSVSRAVANSQVTAADLARLAKAGAPYLGSMDAKLIIVEFLDFDCPFCHQSVGPVREIMDEYKDRVRLVVRDFPIEELHPNAVSAALAARCAHEQGKFWPYHDKLYAQQERRDEADFQRFAREVGLAEEKFLSCFRTKKYLDAVNQDLKDGLQAGVQGTPTFFFNGTRIQGGMEDPRVMRLLIDQFLKAMSATSTSSAPKS